jgi:hypothetical protein
VLRLVDDHDGVCLESDERTEKILERVHEVVADRCWRLRAVFGDDAEVLEELLQQVVASEQRVIDDGNKRLPGKTPLKHRPPEQRLAGADFAGDDDQWLASFDGVCELCERRYV